MTDKVQTKTDEMINKYKDNAVALSIGVLLLVLISVIFYWPLAIVLFCVYLVVLIMLSTCTIIKAIDMQTQKGTDHAN